MSDYLIDPNITKDYEFHLHDVVCKHCGLCNSGSHDWTGIRHRPWCNKFLGNLDDDSALESIDEVIFSCIDLDTMEFHYSMDDDELADVIIKIAKILKKLSS